MLSLYKMRNVARNVLRLAVFAFPLVWGACSNDGKVAGGTEAESTIALQVQLADGTPAAHARVRVLPSDYLSNGDARDWMLSDSSGFVELTAETGNYAVEVRNVQESGAMGAVMKLSHDAKIARVDTVRLVGLSTIEGFVLQGDYSPVFRVAGLDRYVVPDSNGYFVIDSLPMGSFDVNVADLQGERSTSLQSATGDTLYVSCSDSSVKVVKPEKTEASVYPEGDWSEHDALISQVDGYAMGVLGAAGVTDSLGNIAKAEGQVCIVTTTEDYQIVEDTTEVDSAGNAKTTAVIAPGSLRECAYREGPTWVLFEKNGTYNLQAPLRLKSDKTFDGRGRDVRIAGMGVLTEESSNLVFENLRFTAPAITVQDTSSRRALSIHNLSHHVWVDHCTFEEYPLVELDVKRGSHNVTISWSKFENAQTGILFGLPADMVKDTAQTLSLHHNYFVALSDKGIRAHGGKLHAYNNLFVDVKEAGVECADSARCYVEKNAFNIDNPVRKFSFVDDEGVPVDTTLGFVTMLSNLNAGEDVQDSLGYRPDYEYSADEIDADFAWRVRNRGGTR